jgi:hypothetical protein
MATDSGNHAEIIGVPLVYVERVALKECQLRDFYPAAGQPLGGVDTLILTSTLRR